MRIITVNLAAVPLPAFAQRTRVRVVAVVRQ